ncbi:E3 ubiquitin-protein ligase CHFR isoform X2 [Cajanus cajan]|uniref:E3 ubiquitin-protein ligase CHFR n=1 Tax=Cajanus cajan TaxID=3821 RepID=A0A151S2D8_CAJCA|nr:E3 ubiquitin-protein ligase CHFR isoform X2 [Cajanus cajan]KYP48973.1 E3 ubiquitin-protein ligase CHFR [Cajanus cajan]
MEERGESSSSANPSDEIWAKLVPSDERYSDVEIRSDEKVITSEISTTSNDKHSWCKIVRNPDLCSATMENKSQNTILVDGAELHSDDTIVIKDGSQIIPRPDREGFVSYKFHIMSSPNICQRQLKICVDVDHAKCSICLNIWHDVVTVAPCLHNFCNGCFSEWLRRSKERHSAVLCPQCRALVQFVGRNHFLRTIAEDMLRADSSLGRSHDEVALLDTYALVRSNLVIGSGKKSRKRAYASLDDQSDGTDHQCPQCVTEVDGFRCVHDTVHLQCQACGGMMPSRTGFGIPQYCSGCDRPFCGAYWHALGVTGNGSHPVCSQDTLKTISEHSISRIPLLAHEKNLHEQNITDSCIRQMGRTLPDVISEWIAKLDNREIDRTGMMLNNAEMITARTFVCRDCYHKLVSFLLYWFRVSIPKHLLPPDASAREDCWYGYACRTQHRSQEHSRKRNHVCRPTRGSNM